MSEKRIVSVDDYGKIVVCLKEVMDAKEMTRYRLARSIDARFEVIDKWYRGEVEKLDLDILARICCVLNCKPEDIIKYVSE